MIAGVCGKGLIRPGSEGGLLALSLDSADMVIFSVSFCLRIYDSLLPFCKNARSTTFMLISHRHFVFVFKLAYHGTCLFSRHHFSKSGIWDSPSPSVVGYARECRALSQHSCDLWVSSLLSGNLWGKLTSWIPSLQLCSCSAHWWASNTSRMWTPGSLHASVTSTFGDNEWPTTGCPYVSLL